MRVATDPRTLNGTSTTKTRVALWRLDGAIDALVCVVGVTSYGHTLSLELGGEVILLELQPNLETLCDKAARLEAWLLTQGWRPPSQG